MVNTERTGVWLSGDGELVPAEHADPANLYRYGRNNPTNLTDPSGLQPPNPTRPPNPEPPSKTDIDKPYHPPVNLKPGWDAVDTTWSESQALGVLRDQIKTWRKEDKNFVANLLQHFIDKKGPAPYEPNDADIEEVREHSANLIRMNITNNSAIKTIRDWGSANEKPISFDGPVRWFINDDPNLFYAYYGANLKYKGTAYKKGATGYSVVYDADVEITITDDFTFGPTNALGIKDLRLWFKSYEAAHFLETKLDYKPFASSMTFTKRFTKLETPNLGPDLPHRQHMPGDRGPWLP